MSLVIDNYEVGELLHRGSRFDVHRGRHRVHGNALALKFVHQGMNISVVQNVLRECRVIASLPISGVPLVYDLGEHQGRIFVVMQLLAGAERLSDVLARQGPFAPGAAAPLVGQLLGTVVEMHDANVAHENLRAENVLLVPQAEHLTSVMLNGFEGAREGGEKARDLEACGLLLRRMIAGPPESIERPIARAPHYPNARALRDDIMKGLSD